MHRTILIFLILSNIVGGIEVASDVEDVWGDFGVLSSSSGELHSSSDSGTDPLESSDCDHCCHSGAHYAGFISSAAITYCEHQAQITPFVESIYHLALRAPPTPPPNA